jgi:hypothetical protein
MLPFVIHKLVPVNQCCIYKFLTYYVDLDDLVDGDGSGHLALVEPGVRDPEAVL